MKRDFQRRKAPQILTGFQWEQSQWLQIFLQWIWLCTFNPQKLLQLFHTPLHLKFLKFLLQRKITTLKLELWIHCIMGGRGEGLTYNMATHNIMKFWRENQFFNKFISQIKNNGMSIPCWSLQTLPQNRKCFNKTKLTEMRKCNLLT